MSSAQPTPGPARAPIVISSQARVTIEEAFDRLSASVTLDDRRHFQETHLEDVRNAALQIEKDLAARRSLRNMRRLHPFLQGLEHYSKSIEVLCNGTPYLPWIWAPVKLMLQISSDFLGAFEKLIEAYGKLGDALPRFDRLSTAFKNDHDFQAVVALIYADILEFHRRAYKFVRRRSWTLFFSSMWANFDTRFKAILANIAYHSDLIDKEAISIDIVASSKSRLEALDRFEKQEQEWKNAKLNATLSWLGFSSHVVNDKVDSLTQDCLPGSCDWLLEHAKIKPWLQDKDPSSIVWLYGKPGAGKSVLSASLIQHLEDSNSAVFFYFCSYFDASAGTSAYLFRSLVAQIIQAHPDAALYVAEKYLTSYRAASRKALASLLPELLSIVGTARLIIDGIDEWDSKEQQIILDDLLPLAKANTGTHTCKILVSSRDMPTISRAMRRKKKGMAMLSLRDEHKFIDRSIQSFITSRLSDLQDTLQDLDPHGSTLSQVRGLLLEKSNGMFLWVRLVLDSLDSVYTPEDLYQVVALLPADLSDLYKRIVGKICNPHSGLRHARATAILQWICFAHRPIKLSELLHGVAFTPGEPSPDYAKVPVPDVLELCKPLIEQRSDGTVGFVHFSVQEYLKSDPSGFCNPAAAHLMISFACITTLSDGLCLLHPDVKAQNRHVSIVNGVYGLMIYALEFWQDHILSYAATAGDLSSNALLTTCLLSFWTTHERIKSAQHDSGAGVPSNDSPTTSDSQQANLQLIAHLPLYPLVRDSLQIRLVSQREASRDGQGMEVFAMKNDRTLLSKLATEFESWVLYLLSQTSIPEVPDDRLAKVQTAFASSAFRCRYPFCRNSSYGFATAAQRRQHEVSHLEKVFCSTESCPWSRIGFNNQTSLRTHIGTHHSKDKPNLAPGKIRLWSANDSIESVRQQKRSRLEDDWPPVFSYTKRLDAKTLAEAHLDKISPNYVREGPDWLAFFDPHSPRLLDIDLVQTLPHPGVVTSACFSNCGSYFATCTRGAVTLYEVHSGAVLHTLQCSEGNVDEENYPRDVCFVPSSDVVVAVSEDRIIRTWNMITGQLLHRWRAHESDIYTVSVSDNGNFIVTGSNDRTAKVWDLETRNQSRVLIHDDGITCVGISSDCRLIVTGCLDGAVYVWDIESGSLISRLSGHAKDVYSVAFTSSAQIVSGSLDKTARLWEVDPTLRKPLSGNHYGGSCIEILEGHADFVLHTTAIPNSSWILSSSKDRSVRITDAETGALQCVILGHKNSVIKVKCCPTGKYFITASGDTTARIWRYKPYVKPSEEHEDRVLAATSELPKTQNTVDEARNTLDEEYPSIIKCICSSREDDGNTVLCEKCDTWQHIRCYYISKFHVPDVHECLDCKSTPPSSEATPERPPTPSSSMKPHVRLPPPPGPPIPRPAGGPSSYWSVQEQSDFPDLVAHFGTDWDALANHIGTKTSIMVKIQYLRLVGKGDQRLRELALEADSRRERGEDLGPLLLPNPWSPYEPRVPIVQQQSAWNPQVN